MARIADDLLECVVFLGLPSGPPDKGHISLDLSGTGFFVTVPSETDPDWAYIYLVTAMHVAEKVAGREFYVRFNRQSGGIGLARCAVDLRWWIHPGDAQVDVAVCLWDPSIDAEFKAISTNIFLQDDMGTAHNIGIGSDVCVVGLFTRMSGEKRNHPLVRMGALAMVPKEPVPTRRAQMDAYLIEIRSFGGLSGSPAFACNPWWDPGTGRAEWRFLGLLHGHWNLTPEERHANLDADDGGTTDQINTGIAIVIPAIKILEVLNHTEFAEKRQAHDRERSMLNAREGAAREGANEP